MSKSSKTTIAGRAAATASGWSSGNVRWTADMPPICNNRRNAFNFALSDVSKSQSLIIPYFKNFELDGFATLNRKIYYNKKFRKFRKIKVKTKKLDSFNFKNISFIKIDVEGHEINLLNGSKATFKLNKPDCLIEVKKGNLPKVKKFFESIDSKYYCVPKKKFAFKFSRENYFFSRKQ